MIRVSGLGQVSCLGAREGEGGRSQEENVHAPSCNIEVYANKRAHELSLHDGGAFDKCGQNLMNPQKRSSQP